MIGERPGNATTDERDRAGRWEVFGALAVAAVFGFAASSSVGQALAILALASAPAIVAVPPRGRPVLGIVMVVVLGLVLGAGGVPSEFGVWVSAVALLLAGLLVVWRGRRWPGFGARYAAGGPVKGEGRQDDRAASELWRALDRGEDPTDGVR